MKAVITHDKLEVQDEVLYNSGSIDYYEIDTEFTSDWDNLTKYAIINGAEAVKIPVVANKVKVDRNTSGTYYIGFVGYTIEDDKKTYQISTNLQPIYFQIGAGELPAADPQDLPDPTTWEAYLNEIEAIVNGAENVNITSEKIEDTTYITTTDKTGTATTTEIIDGKDAKINGVNTITIEGGENVTIEQEGSTLTINATDTTDYEELSNKPSINGVELSGNKTSSDLNIKQTYNKSDVGLGNVDNVRQYSVNNPPPYPVNSVNGNTGAVVIDTHDDLIPTQASPTNKLTTEGFVNSTVATSTATFRGTYNSLAELEQVTADENDYGFVVDVDSAGNTVYNRYKYASGTWTFEYALNNSSFTAAQWEAIQSGITDDLVTKLQGIEAGAEVNVVEGLKIGNVTQQVSNKIMQINPDTTPVENSTNVIDSNAVYEVEKLLPTDRESGENVDIDNAQPYKVLNVVADGKYQQESTTGKNLLNVDTDLAVTRMYTLNNISIPAGTYHLTNTSATCSDGSSNVTIRFDPERAIYNLSTSQDRTITLTEEATVMYVFAKTDYPTSADLTATVKELMLSTSGGTYEPYTGGIPSPNPNYPQTITQVTSATWNRTGKQFFQNEYISTPGSTINAKLPTGTYALARCDGNTFNKNIYIKLFKNNSVVTTSGHLTADTSMSFSSSSYSYYGGAAVSKITFTIDDDYEANIGLLEADGTKQVMLVKGSTTERTYEPYQGQTIPIDLDGNEVCATDTVKDKLLVDRYGNVALQKNVGKVVLNGTESWVYENRLTTPTNRTVISGWGIRGIRFAALNYYSDYFMYGSTTSNRMVFSGDRQIFISLDDTLTGVVSGDTNDEARDKVKSWLSAHNTTAYYVLATPTIIPLPKLSVLPTTLKGINHIWVDTNLGITQIEVEYVKDLSLDIPTKTSDLTNDSGYVKNTDYASSSTGGTIKVSTANGVTVGSSGNLIGSGKSYSTYLGSAGYMIIAKDTLENVITGKELVNKTYVDTLVGDIETALTTLDVGGGVQ